VNCYSSTNPAPHFDPIDSRCRPCYVDAGPTSGALDYVAHGCPSNRMFMKSTLLAFR